MNITKIPSPSLFAVKNANKRLWPDFTIHKKRAKSRQTWILQKCLDSFCPQTTQPFSSYVSSCQLLDFFCSQKTKTLVCFRKWSWWRWVWSTWSFTTICNTLPWDWQWKIQINEMNYCDLGFWNKNHHILLARISGQRDVCYAYGCGCVKNIQISDSWLVNLPPQKREV